MNWIRNKLAVAWAWLKSLFGVKPQAGGGPGEEGPPPPPKKQ